MMNKHTTYRVELEPLGNFFLGGENTFGEGEQANYFAMSNRYPQQSALIGLLRFELLQEKGLMPLWDHRQKAKEIIGEKSFSFTDNQSSDFGILKKVSPVFLTCEGEDYFPVPLDEGYQDKIVFEKCNNRTYIGGEVKDWRLDCMGYIPKEYDNGSKYIGAKSGKQKMEKDFFFSSIKIGINASKSRETGDDKGAFFKQEYLQMPKNCSYVFYLDLCEDAFFDGSTRIISLGGEQSMFRMCIKKKDNDYESTYRKLFPRKKSIMLISEAFVQDKSSFFKHADFTWTDTLVFRNIITSIQKDDYSKMPKKSNKINLLKRSSVFYYDSEANRKAIVQALEITNLQNFGFNLYID